MVPGPVPIPTEKITEQSASVTSDGRPRVPPRPRSQAICPDCGGPLIREGRCGTCPLCGFSACG